MKERDKEKEERIVQRKSQQEPELGRTAGRRKIVKKDLARSASVAPAVPVGLLSEPHGQTSRDNLSAIRVGGEILPVLLVVLGRINGRKS